MRHKPPKSIQDLIKKNYAAINIGEKEILLSFCYTFALLLDSSFSAFFFFWCHGLLKMQQVKCVYQLGSQTAPQRFRAELNHDAP
jgi:hypothetical protein